jgi:hypothetical protein
MGIDRDLKTGSLIFANGRDRVAQNGQHYPKNEFALSGLGTRKFPKVSSAPVCDHEPETRGHCRNDGINSQAAAVHRRVGILASGSPFHFCS